MPTPDPSLNDNRRGPRGLRVASGGAGRYTGAASFRPMSEWLAVVCLAIGGLLAAGCSQQSADVDAEAREAAMKSRLQYAGEVASASVPEGAEEVARLGYVKEGVATSLAAAQLSSTFASIDELAVAVLEGIEHDRGQALWSLALTEEEFRQVVWPVLPASRPERNTPFEYTWGTLEFKSSNALNTTLAKYRGHHYELIGVDFAGHKQRKRDYGAFWVHRDARVLVRKEDGSEVWLDLFGSVIERGGRFKVFSYVTD